MKFSGVHLNICNRHIKQTTVSCQKIVRVCPVKAKLTSNLMPSHQFVLVYRIWSFYNEKWRMVHIQTKYGRYTRNNFVYT